MTVRRRRQSQANLLQGLRKSNLEVGAAQKLRNLSTCLLLSLGNYKSILCSHGIEEEHRRRCGLLKWSLILARMLSTKPPSSQISNCANLCCTAVEVSVDPDGEHSFEEIESQIVSYLQSSTAMLAMGAEIPTEGLDSTMRASILGSKVASIMDGDAKEVSRVPGF